MSTRHLVQRSTQDHSLPSMYRTLLLLKSCTILETVTYLPEFVLRAVGSLSLVPPPSPEVQGPGGKDICMFNLCYLPDHSLLLGSCDCSNWGYCGAFRVKLDVIPSACSELLVFLRLWLHGASVSKKRFCHSVFFCSHLTVSTIPWVHGAQVISTLFLGVE